jgi:hypothetical protein
MCTKKPVLVILILIMATITEGQGSKTTKSPATISSPATKATAMKLYRNDSFRIAINYPADWKVVDKSSAKDHTLNVDFGDGITLRDIRPFDTGIEYAEDMSEAFEESLSGYDTGYSMNITIGKKEFYDFTSSYKNGTAYWDIGMLIYTASAGNGGGGYVLTIECPTKEYAKYEKIREEMAATLQELPPRKVIYSSKEFKISTSYPSDWKLTNSFSDAYLSFASNRIRITEAANGGSSLAETADKEMRKSHMKDYTVVEKKEFTSKGKKIYRIAASYIDKIRDDKPFSMFTYISSYIEKGITKYFKIECSCAGGQTDRMAPYFDQFVKSIDFKK